MSKKKEKIYKNIRLPSKIKPLTISFIEAIIDTFEQEKKLNSLDNLSIYLLASNLDIYFQCEEEIRKTGLTIITDRGNASLSPYASQMKVAYTAILNLLKELGLTLGSRSKIKAISEAPEESPLLKLLKDDNSRD